MTKTALATQYLLSLTNTIRNKNPKNPVYGMSLLVYNNLPQFNGRDAKSKEHEERVPAIFWAA